MFALQANDGDARAGVLHLGHGPVRTPVFMPVGTQATVKSVTSDQLADLDLDIILANTFHLGLRPGGETLSALGGVHTFANWPRNVLTDSGGFQMVSLLQLATISEEGVHFQSPVDGAQVLLTPELSIRLQNQIGADIIMALDDVVPTTASDPERFKEATARTIRWLDRCIAAHTRPREQLLFGIVQGGLDTELRCHCLNELATRDLPGYAIGGLAGGEEKDKFWRVVRQCTQLLPREKPRYCMGVGYPEDLLVCVALGVDMFDCVYPARTARFGSALVDGPAPGILKVRSAGMFADSRPIEPQCPCECCRHYSRAYLHVLMNRDPAVVGHVLTVHNISYLTRLMRSAREAIFTGSFANYLQRWFARRYPSGAYPNWVRDALATCGVGLI
ncbi:Queuine tRNA-ribosyltransferase catalytic subunit 1 [Cyanidiococcus yangmingshanensis]|uniref:Queuine tRNA-ribosyltransferase catalytic subunit 1 n=1 Tax=Cyanidiococcus yangmingshanensis TaxID=2690220 RepID=A0A7J7IJN6_9RHOD|nr:Queuine tRNA-ribosyltransferase catalytic subunit 1 [Cyanidiococcus yangmingshanensis]